MIGYQSDLILSINNFRLCIYVIEQVNINFISG